jgi:hypothetical protein
MLVGGRKENWKRKQKSTDKNLGKRDIGDRG